MYFNSALNVHHSIQFIDIMNVLINFLIIAAFYTFVIRTYVCRKIALRATCNDVCYIKTDVK